MGVLHFESHLKHQQNIHDIISYDDNNIALHDEDIDLADRRTSVKRKHMKSSPEKSYDFRNYGVDQRRRSAKHKRRKENLIDLLDFVGEEVAEDVFETDDCMTVFAELFMDEDKMKLWQNFVNLPEERQKDYLDSLSNHEEICESEMDIELTTEETSFLSIDKKIRDMLCTKKLAHQGLLEYYEEDMRSCIESEFPTVLVMNLEKKYDRMLVYAVCQYLHLPAETIRLRGSTLIEIDINRHFSDRPTVKLIEYLQRKVQK